MGSMADVQRGGFDDRITRIRSGSSPNAMGRIEVGPREEVRAHEAKKRKGKHIRKVKLMAPRESFGSLLFSFPAALVVGAFSFAAGRVAAFHLLTPQGLYPLEIPPVVWRIELWGDIALAAVLALMLAWIFKMDRGPRKTAVLLGFAAMMSGEVFVMQQFPEIFERFYTPSYVTATIAKPVAFF